MWNEKDHPRDENGQFIDKASSLLGVELDDNKPKKMSGSFNSIKEFRDYQQKNSKYNNKSLYYLDGAGALSNKKLEEIIKWYGNIPKNVFFVGNRPINSKDQFEKAVNDGLVSALNQYKRKQESDLQKQKDDLQKDELLQDYIDRSGFDKDYAIKIRNIIKELEKYDENISQKQGYEGESVRSQKAKLDGKYPLSVAKKLFGLSEKQIKDNFRKSEWHHTGTLYNKTDYYDLGKLKDALYNDDFKYIKEVIK